MTARSSPSEGDGVKAPRGKAVGARDGLSGGCVLERAIGAPCRSRRVGRTSRPSSRSITMEYRDWISSTWRCASRLGSAPSAASTSSKSTVTTLSPGARRRKGPISRIRPRREPSRGPDRTLGDGTEIVTRAMRVHRSYESLLSDPGEPGTWQSLLRPANHRRQAHRRGARADGPGGRSRVRRHHVAVPPRPARHRVGPGGHSSLRPDPELGRARAERAATGSTHASEAVGEAPRQDHQAS